MRALLAGNHSTVHCGSVAVWKSLNHLVRKNGWKVVGSGDYDALIVNGEGTMHHSSSGWHAKMRLLGEAMDSGKRAYLVNSVWQENGHDYDAVLRALSGIWVREVSSQDDLADRHGITATVSPDLSFFRRETPLFGSKNFGGKPVMTDFYSREFETFAMPRISALKGMRKAAMDVSWGSFVASLRSAAFLATGRHHAVYAACQARLPFAAVEGNTHKISGLVRTAGANIPVASSLSELSEIMRSIESNHLEYEKLFDWMEAQDPANALPHPS